MSRIGLYFLLVILFSFYSCYPSYAELLNVEFSGDELRKIALIEFEIEVKPDKTAYLNPDYNFIDAQIQPGDVIKNIDSPNSKVRVFFKAGADINNLNLRLKLDRDNYKETIQIKFGDINYVAKFSQYVDANQIQHSIKIVEEDILPFAGITSLISRGPKARLRSERLNVFINDIETYGFTLNPESSDIKINGQKALIMNDNALLISKKLDLGKFEEDGVLQDDAELPVIMNVNFAKQSVEKQIIKLEYLTE